MRAQKFKISELLNCRSRIGSDWVLKQTKQPDSEALKNESKGKDAMQS